MPTTEVSIVIPCLNEENTIAACIRKAQSAFAEKAVAGEIIVVDNGSSDRSAAIAKSLGARVIEQPEKGYGAAYRKGFEVANGDYIVMGDGDDTYDFSCLFDLIKPLKDGYDFVIGSRFLGAIRPGAMSFSHRFIGNPVLTGIFNVFFHARISDAHSGFRAITKQALTRLHLQTTGMEFASEMIVSALREKLSITEVPITYGARKGSSKLNTFSDAWRHIRFMLLFSPNWLFLVPGSLLFGGGLLAFFITSIGQLSLLGHTFDIHAMLFFTAFILLGFQILSTWVFAKAFSVREGLIHGSRLLDRFSGIVSLERTLMIGSIFFLMGFGGSIYIFIEWAKVDFVGYFIMLKQSLYCLLFMVIGLQTVFSAFFISLLRTSKN